MAKQKTALPVIAIAIYTLFASLVVVDPPILNRTKWSALDIALNIYNGNLPIPGGNFDGGLLEIAVIYVLMILALVLCGSLVLQKHCWRSVPLDSSLVPLPNFWDSAFHWTFGDYGHMQQWHMSHGPAWWILPWIMPALMAICFAKTLDEPDPESLGN